MILISLIIALSICIATVTTLLYILLAPPKALYIEDYIAVFFLWPLSLSLLLWILLKPIKDETS